MEIKDAFDAYAFRLNYFGDPALCKYFYREIKTKTWIFRLRAGDPAEKRFRDAIYGGPTGSLAAAAKWRDLCKEMIPERFPCYRVNRMKCKNGVTQHLGVYRWYEKGKWVGWKASIMLEGKVYVKYVRDRHNVEAAIQWRLQKAAEIDEQKGELIFLGRFAATQKKLYCTLNNS